MHPRECDAIASGVPASVVIAPFEVVSPEIVVVYLVIDALVESFFPVLSDFDDAIDSLEDDILKAPTEAQLGTLFDMKRRLMDMRKSITPQAPWLPASTPRAMRSRA